MQCVDAIALLDDHIDSQLSANQTTLLNFHLSTCTRCRQELFQREMLVQRLSEMASVAAPQHLKDRIIRQRLQNHRQNARWFFGGVGLAATIMLAVVSVWLLQHTLVDAPVVVAKQEAKNNNDLHLLLHSAQGLEGVRFSILVPESVQLKGYPAGTKIAWVGKLRKGENILTLPLVSKAQKPQVVVLKIEHRDAKKEYHIQLAARTT